MGPPGPWASTHIYDGKISQVDFEGRVFIRGVKSRRPPQNGIHWYTTNRLSTPNLVGIVKLSNNGASLRENDLVTWGEVVPHGNSYEEHWRREEGRLAVSISSISDIVIDNLLRKGDDIAVIDCFTFVPEYIPVLL